MNIGEFEFIERIKAGFNLPEGMTGIGDDCAVIPQASGLDTIVTTDLLVEGVHFLMEDASPEDIGWKSAAVNLSDIAAMGGKPVATFLSVAIPGSVDESWMARFIEGYKQLSDIFKVPLAGGDTTSSKGGLSICVTVLGQLPSGKAKLRSSAVAGDQICVTGFLGDSAAGLKAILEGSEKTTDMETLVRRHYRPLPRIAEGQMLLSSSGVHALMDISDGIASDLKHILEASGVGAVIDTDSLPISPELSRVAAEKGWDAYRLAACGGEDYELLFTKDPAASLPLDYTVVGKITKIPGLIWKGSDTTDYKGFTHF